MTFQYLALGVTAVLACLLNQVGGVCEDVHSNACALLALNKDVCGDQQFAMTTCPRYCKLCPLECYSCDSDIGDPMNCNVTSICAKNETCMLKTLKSTVDGRIEYEMGCAAKTYCDGANGGFIGKREEGESRTARDVHLRCCNNDMCNHPPTPGSTVAPIDCARDIEFLIDDSSSVSAQEFATSINFIQNLVKGLQIGHQAAQVGVATFDASVHNQFELGTHQNGLDLYMALNHVKSTVGGGSNVEAAVSFAVTHALKRRYGDRPAYPDVVILVADGKSHHINQTVQDAIKLHGLSKDVIAVSVTDHPSPIEMNAIATDAGHVVSAAAYPDLLSPAVLETVRKLMCPVVTSA